MDRTDGFKEIGGNLALALSTAFLKAFAKEADMNLFNYVASLMPGKRNMEMPKPLCNIVGGWNRKGMQEFLLFPVHQDSFMSSVEKMAEAYREVAGKIKQADPEFDHGKNIESAWVTDLPTEKVLDILKGVADKNMLKIGLDVAASQLWDGKNYVCGDERLSRPEFSAFIYDLVEKYPISYVEDPLHEDDFLGFGIISQRLGYKGKFVCGDDLYATNIKRLKEGIVNRSTNAVIVKPNQIGTITDTINFVSEAQAHKWKIVVSHRSGETEDTMLCHLAVGVGADFVKFGIAGDRTPKINEMIRIEEKLKR
jgi:enolase